MAQVIPFCARPHRPQAGTQGTARSSKQSKANNNRVPIDRAKALIEEALLSVRAFNYGRRQCSNKSSVEALKSFAVNAELQNAELQNAELQNAELENSSDFALISDHDALEWMLSDCLEILDNI